MFNSRSAVPALLPNPRTCSSANRCQLALVDCRLFLEFDRCLPSPVLSRAKPAILASHPLLLWSPSQLFVHILASCHLPSPNMHAPSRSLQIRVLFAVFRERRPCLVKRAYHSRNLPAESSHAPPRYNVTLLSPKTQLMQTGAHLLSEVQCGSCSAYLGYKIIRAVEETERWKESSYLLELAELTTHEPFHLPQTPKPNIAP
ncbi:unnamed protein product [Mycena citricolor]|uniref:Yippee domain-containing protein n=1 Tax=Mycena citricolor TaxID=2018698 RepID=A0AAD2K6C6_9AGAR|nr:unnamed protein product [Mycena citricolor]